ncbi:hypothetical protein JRQ81_016371, partial [Phrynocephalus forsythii]
MMGYIQGEKWLKWSLQLDDNIKQLLKTDELQGLRQLALQGPQNIYGIYQNIINALRPLLTTTHEKKDQGAQTSWFDNDCQRTPSAHLRTELSLPSVGARIDLAYFRYWQRLNGMDDQSLTKRCWLEQLRTEGWAKQCQVKLKTYDLSMERLLSFDPSSNSLKNWIFDSDACQDRATIIDSRFSKWYPKLQINHLRPKYFETLTIPQLHWAFTELRFQQMPSAYLEGRYKKIPVMEHKCFYGCDQIEDIIHYLLFCPLYKNPRARLLWPITKIFPACSNDEIVLRLLADNQSSVTHSVTLFALAAKKL